VNDEYAVKEVFVSDVTHICFILRSICSEFPFASRGLL